MVHEHELGGTTTALGALGKYPLEQKLGEGGMGVVWLGLHPDLGIRVAIKAIKPDKDDPEYVDRFLQEARSAALVNHPRVGRIYDAGIDGDTHFIVMEYLQGGSIGELLREGPMEVSFATYVAEAVAEGLAAAAEAGVIHRDVKPDNIMLDAKGEPKLVDLGLAKEVGGDSNLTTVGMLMGTPSYIAPEQATSAATVDTRADIYSLGATLFHMVTGKEPYQAATPMATALCHCMDPVPEPLDSNPDLPKGLCRIIQKMMAKAPEDRYQSATDVVKALRGKGGKAADSGRPRRKKRQFRKGDNRKRETMAAKEKPVASVAPVHPPPQSPSKRGLLVVLGLLVLVACLGGLLYFSGGETDEPDTGSSALALRQQAGLIMLYEFSEGMGSEVVDTSAVGEPLNLTVKNPHAVEWQPGRLMVAKKTIIQAAKPPQKMFDAIQASQEMSCEVWVIPGNLKQEGPARIISYSKDTSSRNFTLGQEGESFDFRFRTKKVGNQGMPAMKSKRGSCRAELMHVVFTRDRDGQQQLYVNGVAIAQKVDKSAISNWDEKQIFALGNEITEDRPWLGTYDLVAVYSKRLTATEIMALYNAGTNSHSQSGGDL